jgi:predicted transcriptional regulator
MHEDDEQLSNAERRFVEALGLFFEDVGISRIGGRLLGLLLIAEQPLSLDAIARTLGVSRASVSTNGRLLLSAGLIERVSMPGDRRDYYCFATHGWEPAILSGIRRSQTFRHLAMQALPAIEPDNTAAQARLREALDFYGFFEEELAGMLERWRTRPRHHTARPHDTNDQPFTTTAARSGLPLRSSL